MAAHKRRRPAALRGRRIRRKRKNLRAHGGETVADAGDSGRAAECALCGQQLQVGRRRIFVYGGGPCAVRFGAPAAGIFAAGIAETTLYLSEDQRWQGNRIWNRMVRRSIKVGTKSLRARR